MQRRDFILACSSTITATTIAGCFSSGDQGDENLSDMENNNTSRNERVNESYQVEAEFSITPQVPDAGSAVTLDGADSRGDIRSYEWSLQNNILRGKTATTTFQQAGEYDVTLTVTGADGTTARTVKTVIVAQPTEQGFTISEDTPPVVGREVKFRSNNTDADATMYRWDFDGDRNAEKTTDKSVVTHVFDTSGEKIISLEIDQSDGPLLRSRTSIRVFSHMEYIRLNILAVDERLDVLLSNWPDDAQSELQQARTRNDAAQEAIELITQTGGDERVNALDTMVGFQKRLIQDYRMTDDIVSGITASTSGISATVVIDGSTQPLEEGTMRLETASSTLEELRSNRLELESIQQELDGIRFNERQVSYDGELREYVVYGQQMLEMLSQTIETLTQLFTVFHQIAKGRQAFQDERWQDAIGAFRTAMDANRTLQSTIMDVESFVPANAPVSVAEIQSLNVDSTIQKHIEAGVAAANGRVSQGSDIYTEATNLLNELF